MLVLSRKKGERIVIGDDVFVEVVLIGRDQVRIGIQAPKSVTVHREEVYENIRAGIPRPEAADQLAIPRHRVD